MTVLVTGGAGYIGSHVVKELLERGYDTVTLDDLSKGHRRAVPGGAFVEGDCGDPKLVDWICQEYCVRVVVHLAADSLVGESMVKPARYCRNNLINGINLLDALIGRGVCCFIFSSTAAVYGEPQEVPITEDHPARPVNVYGATKLMLENVLDWYDRAYGLRYVSLRYFNAAGADESAAMGEDHDPETHLIPIVLQAALGLREKVTVFGDDYPTPDGTCIRDYIHVTDLAAAHALAVDALLSGRPSAVYNLGNERGHSVREVIDTARRVTGRDIPVETGFRREGDPAVLVAGSHKIQRELGWRPRYDDLETIIRTAWEWHRRHPGGYGG